VVEIELRGDEMCGQFRQQFRMARLRLHSGRKIRRVLAEQIVGVCRLDEADPKDFLPDVVDSGA
jgi:hypothetical protein